MITPKKLIHTISSSEMRAINRSAILEMIRRNGPLSQAEIADLLNVSPPTVMRIVDGLLEENLIRLTHHKQRSGGRKRSLIEFNGDSHVVVGVDLGGTKIYGAVADLSGTVLYETDVFHHETCRDESFDLLCRLIEELLVAARNTGKSILGIGVAVPGITNPLDGNVLLAPGLQWLNFPLKARLTDRFHLPITVENDVNLAALGELWFGGRPNLNNLVLITVGTGIGAGIVIDGKIYPGTHHMAGEIGYFLPDPSHLGKRYPGFGALEQYASGTGIAERARQLLQDEWPEAKLRVLTADDVFSASRNNEPWAEQILSTTIDYLAQAIAAVAVFFDPDIILLGGGVARSADLLIEPILRRIEGSIPFTPNVAASILGYRAAVMGSIVQLLRITSEYYSLQKFV